MEGEENAPLWLYPTGFPREEPVFTEEDCQSADAARAWFFTNVFELDASQEWSTPNRGLKSEKGQRHPCAIWMLARMAVA